MKKKGFTLVELLAVIAILAILVIMALPAVLRMFNSARKDSFTNEVNTVIRTARQQYLLSGGQAQSWSNAEGSTNKLNLTGNSNLKYYVEMNGQGQIIKLQASNGDFQYSKTGIIDIVSSSDVVEVTESNQLVINANGVGEPTEVLFFEYTIEDNSVSLTGYKSVGNVTYNIDITTCKNYLMTNYGYSDANATSYCDKDSGSEHTIEQDLFDDVIPTEEYSSWGLSNVNVEKTIPPTDLVIPSTIDGKPVTSIGNRAFSDKQLTSLVMPDTITSIGNYAFSGNQLTSVTIPSSVTSIGNYAFSGNQLSSVIISDGVTSIGEYTFSYNQLTSITIPSSISNIGKGSYNGNSINSIIINYAPGYESITDSLFYNYRLAAEISNVTLTIGEGITSIGHNAFFRVSIANASLPSSLKTIGDSAFRETSITSINIPNGVTSIESSAFQSCLLTSVTIPGSVNTIGTYAFNGNPITELVISEGVVSINNYAFYSNQLTSLTIPSSVTVINTDAFARSKLTSVIIKGKNSSSEFSTYYPNWGWASDVTCTKNNTSNVTNGCITWGA